MTSLFLALTAALSYGLSDFVGGLASRGIKPLHVVLVSYPISVVLTAVIAPLAGGTPTMASLLWGALSGIAGGLAILWFYAALAAGPMNVVSPITALLSAALPMLGGLALGEHSTTAALCGAVLAVGAVVLVSREERSSVAEESTPARLTRRVLWLTFGSGAMFALYFMLLHRIEVGTGLWGLVLSRVSACVTMLVVALIVGQLGFARGKFFGLAATAAALDVTANVAMLYALQAGMLSLVSVLASLYPAATVIMARLVLGERSNTVQKLGMGLAAVSVALIASGS